MKIRHIGNKLSIAIIVGIMLVGIILSVMAIGISKGIIEETLGDKALAIAVAAAEHLDGDAFENLLESRDTTLDYYLENQKWMNRLLHKTNTMYLYSMVEASDTEYMYVIDGSDNLSELGDLDLKENYGEEPVEVLKTGIGMYSDIYDAGEYGMLISAFAPIVNAKGEVVGIVGCDVRAEKVDAIAKDFIIKLSTGVIVTVILFVAVFYYLVQNMVTKPIGHIGDYSSRIADKDYSFDIDPKLMKREDEVGDLIKGIKNIKDQTSLVLKDIVSSSETLVSSSENLSEIAEQTAQSIDEVSKSVNEIAINATNQADSSTEGHEMINELHSNVDENSMHIGQLVQSSDEMNRLVVEGKASIDDVMARSNETAQAITDIQNKISVTSSSSEQISKASSVIASIADQTNLLALNAAIEAARAGEHGKGFAVVADEIRMLAEQSAASTKEIDSVVQQLFVNLKETVEVMESVIGYIDAQKESVSSSLEKYNLIDGGIENTQITVSALQTSSERIMENTKQLQEIISHIAGFAETNAANTEEVSASTQEQNASMNEVADSGKGLSELAHHLKELVDEFKL